MVTLLNTDTEVSRDRLVRVLAKPTADTSGRSDIIEVVAIILFENVLARHSGKFVNCRVQRMISHSHNSRVEYSNPVALPCSNADIKVTMNLYEPVQHGAVFPNKHGYIPVTARLYLLITSLHQ